jgi:Uma2 family endonuclease
MSAVAERLLTEEEYLALEENGEERHEYIDGVLRLMAGTTDEHNELVLNIATKLLVLGRAKGCRVRAENLKLRLPTGSKRRYYYPDIIITCEPKDNNKIIENPCFVVEVLSESTEHIDKGEKLETYQRILSLKQYVLVDQTRRKVEVYTRSESVWIYQMLEAGSFNVACLDVAMTLDEVYAGLEVEPVKP